MASVVEQRVKAPQGTVFRDRDLRVLADVCAARLQTMWQQDDTLLPALVICSSPVMLEWLQRRVVQRLGILANVRFAFPNELWEPFRGGHEGEGRKRSFTVWDRDTLPWLVANAMQQGLDEQAAELNALRVYMGMPLVGQGLGRAAAEPASAGLLDRKALGLAREVAQVFDRYVYQAPELAVYLSGGHQSRVLDGVLPLLPEWQRWLWARVNQLAEQAGAGRGAHLASLVLAPSSGSTTVRDYARVMVFGVGFANRLLLRSLERWSESVPVDWFQPGLEVWEERPVRHLREPKQADGRSLYDLFGRLAWSAQLQYQSFSEGTSRWFTGVEIPEAFGPTRVADEGTWAAGLSLLNWVQQIADRRPPADDKEMFPGRVLVDVVQGDLTDEREPVWQQAGPSLQLHGCHGLMRQVEVLRDRLVALLDARPDLQPSDIVILSPVLEEVLPLFRTVFRAPVARSRGGSVPLPWRQPERSIRDVSPPAVAMARALQMATGRFSAPELEELCRLDPIALRYRFSASDQSSLQELIESTGFRWGFDAHHRRQFLAGEFGEYALDEALDRMALGVALRDVDGLVCALVPLDQIEGSAADMHSRFDLLCRTLTDLHLWLQTPRTLPEWVGGLCGTDTEVGFLERLVAVDVTRKWQIDMLRERWQEAARQKGVPHTARIEGAALVSWINTTLDAPAPHLPSARAGITLASLAPGRVVGARVLCLLGVDDGTFPRGDLRPEWDMTRHYPGHHSPRDDDRGVFFDALLQAQDYLLLFFSHRDPISNEALAWAPPIAELRDTLALWGVKDTSWVMNHPMTPFSPELFSGGSGSASFTYSGTMARTAMRMLQQERIAWQRFPEPMWANPFAVFGGGEAAACDASDWQRGLLHLAGKSLPASVLERTLRGESGDPVEVIDVDVLVRALRHPVKTWLTGAWGVWIGEEDDQYDEFVPWKTNSLQDTLIYSWLDARADRVSQWQEAEIAEAFEQVRQLFLTAPREPGRWGFQNVVSSFQAADAERRKWADGETGESRVVEFTVDNLVIRQRLHGVYGDHMLMVNRSSTFRDSWMRFWLHLLLFQSQSIRPVEVILFSGGKQGNTVSTFRFRLPDISGQTAQQTATVLLSRLLGIYRLTKQFRVHGFTSVGSATSGNVAVVAVELPAMLESGRGLNEAPAIMNGKVAHAACFARWWADGPPWYAPPEQEWRQAAQLVWEAEGGFSGVVPDRLTPWGQFVFGDSSPWAGDEDETRLNATLGAWLIDVWCPFVGSLTAVAPDNDDGDGADNGAAAGEGA